MNADYPMNDDDLLSPLFHYRVHREDLCPVCDGMTGSALITLLRSRDSWTRTLRDIRSLPEITR